MFSIVFSSLLFLYAFFPFSLLAYALCRENQRAQNVVLLIFSLIFYAWGEPKYVLLLMAMAFTAWLCARQAARFQRTGRKVWVGVAAAVMLTLLGYFKYASLICGIFGPVPQWVQRIALPIGISFYTFQLLTYVVDVARGDSQAQDSYWNVLLYAALFHQCIAGPIVRYQTIDRELFGPEPRRPELTAGISRFCCGLAKKTLLANPCGALADTMLLTDATIVNGAAFEDSLAFLNGQSVLGSWLGIVAYGLHIYLDFSAYSDMAIGMGRMLGLHYLENFNYPYISATVTEFWRRWHISLGTFFRDYVYIPLGGSRCGPWKTLRNTLIVWCLTGLWHGASWNFLLWGLWFFVFLMLERWGLGKLLKKSRILSHIYLLTVVLVGWTFFRFTDIRLGLATIRSLFGLNGNSFTDFTTEIQFQSHMFLLLAAVLACLPVMKQVKERLASLTCHGGRPERMWNVVLYCVIPVLLLLLSTASLVGDSYNPFIYFRF